MTHGSGVWAPPFRADCASKYQCSVIHGPVMCTSGPQLYVRVAWDRNIHVYGQVGTPCPPLGLSSPELSPTLTPRYQVTSRPSRPMHAPCNMINDGDTYSARHMHPAPGARAPPRAPSRCRISAARQSCFRHTCAAGGLAAGPPYMVPPDAAAPFPPALMCAHASGP